MPSLKDVYDDYYPKLIRVLPMNDSLFIAQLYSNKFLPGDAKESVMVRPTRADKATFFLDNYIVKGFDDDGMSNQLFIELIRVMEKSDDLVLKSVAKEIRNKIK